MDAYARKYCIVYAAINYCLLLMTLHCSQANKDLGEKIVCDGDRVTLHCQANEALNIKSATYHIKRGGLCPRRDTFECNGTRSAFEDECNGKVECVLESSLIGSCAKLVYLRLQYKCEINHTRNMTSNTTFTPTPHQPQGGSSIYLLWRMIAELKDVQNYITDNPRKLLLCTILSVSAGIALFIFYIIIVFCCSKINKSSKHDVEDGVQVSPPVIKDSVPAKYEVLVTHQNGTTTRKHNNESNSFTSGKQNCQLLSTIRRSHSIDEGTQTDNVIFKPRHLSNEEAQELGHLVDTMKCYTTQLHDDFDESTAFTSNKCNSSPELSSPEGTSPTQLLLPPQDKTTIYDDTQSVESLDLYSPESIFNGDTLKLKKPKPGIRGDGYSFIGSSRV